MKLLIFAVVALLAGCAAQTTSNQPTPQFAGPPPSPTGPHHCTAYNEFKAYNDAHDLYTVKLTSPQFNSLMKALQGSGEVADEAYVVEDKTSHGEPDMAILALFNRGCMTDAGPIDADSLQAVLGLAQ